MSEQKKNDWPVDETSEEKYRAVFNASSEGIFIHDAETGAVLDINDTALRMYECRREDVMDMGAVSLTNLSYDETLERGLELLEKTRLEGPQTFEWPARTFSGRSFTAEVTLKSAKIGTQQRVLAVVRDVTKRHQTQKALEHRSAFEALISEVSSNFINLKNDEIDAHIDDTLEKIALFTSCDGAYVFLFDSPTDTLSLCYLYQNETLHIDMAKAQNVPIEVGGSWVAKLLRGQVMIADAFEEIPEDSQIVRTLVRDFSMESLVDVPMMSQGKTIGFLGLTSGRLTRRWSSDEISLLRLVGQVVSNALSRKKAEQEITSFNDRLRHVAGRTGELALCDDLLTLAPRVLELLSENLAAHGGSFYLRDGRSLRLLHSLDPVQSPTRIPLPPLPNTALEHAFELKDGFLIGDTGSDPRFIGFCEADDEEDCFIVLPCLDTDGDIKAILTVRSPKNQPLNDRDLEIGRIIAAHCVASMRAIELSALIKESEQRYRTVIESSLTGIFIVTSGKIAYHNGRLAKIFGLEPQNVDEAERAHMESQLCGQLEEGHSEKEITTPSGAKAWVEILVTRGSRDQSESFIGNVIDITKRRNAEHQLVQSQKMEAIGRLAGGIAHDFNNILTGISGFAELSLSMVTPREPVYLHIEEIQKAAERAGSLTDQLLAFSRKQLVSPRILDLDETIDRSQKMLSRIIGEDVAFNRASGQGLWSVRIDPAQVDQILVNLATNARDAMPDGGTLTVETKNVPSRMLPPGRRKTHDGAFVAIEVRDTGAGISPEVLPRIFEPFYSTKAGQGTGLGLSTVFGIVEQNGGFIEVQTEINRGTTFAIYLPAELEPAAEERGEIRPRRVPRGHETVLVVEDEPLVRNLTRSILETQGYSVLVAEDGPQALEIAQERAEEIHLLLTDVVMPQMNGPELQHALLESRPQIRVLFTSGYPTAGKRRGITVPAGAPFLSKPFTVEGLSRAVRDALDTPGTGKHDVSSP